MRVMSYLSATYSCQQKFFGMRCTAFRQFRQTNNVCVYSYQIYLIFKICFAGGLLFVTLSGVTPTLPALNRRHTHASS